MNKKRENVRSMMITSDEMEETEYQFNRKDPEAIILREFIDKTGKIFDHYSSNHELYIEHILLLEEETKHNLGMLTDEEFNHKLDIYMCQCEDDEREWREQKYGKQ